MHCNSRWPIRLFPDDDRAGVTLIGIQFAVFPPAISGLVRDAYLFDVSN